MSQQVSHRLPLQRAVMKQNKQLPVTALVQLSESLDGKWHHLDCDDHCQQMITLSKHISLSSLLGITAKRFDIKGF